MKNISNKECKKMVENMDKLDITKIKTVEDLDKSILSKYCKDKYCKGFITEIKYPVAQKDLDKICFLSEESKKYKLYNSKGELFYKEGN